MRKDTRNGAKDAGWKAGPECLAILRAHPVFGGIATELLEPLSAHAHGIAVRPGTRLFSKGDPGTALFAIVSGTVKIGVPFVDGREAMFNILKAGDVFGEIALLDGRPRTADAVAVASSKLVVIERRDLVALLQREPRLALHLIDLLCQRLRWASAHFEEVVFFGSGTRLARVVLLLAGCLSRASSPPGAAAGRAAGPISITQEELSHLVGVTRESINKQLRTWQRRKILRLTRGHIDILDPAALTRMARLSLSSE